MTRGRRITVAVIVVALSYGIAQLALVGLDRAPEWDEAVYMSQVAPDVPATDFAAHRARGMTLIIAPTAAAGFGTEATRMLLVVVSSALLAIAFGVWIPIVGWAAPLAAALFSATWLSLFYGSAVSPNLFGSLLAVTAVGSMVRFRLRPSGGTVLGAAAAVAALTLLRPLDGAIALAITVAIAVWANRAGALRNAAALGAGFAAGMLPWIIEAFVRFESPWQRLAYARGPVDAGPTFTLMEHLRLLDGRPLVGPDPTQTVSRGAVLALLVGVGLIIVSLVAARSSKSTRLAAAVCGGGALLFALPYMVWVGATAPRFLFPVFALAAIPAGIGLLTVIEGKRPLAIGLTAILLAVVTAWHIGQVGDVENREAAAAHVRQDVGLALAGLAGDGGCAFASQLGYPQIQLASGCVGIRLDLAAPETAHAFLTDAYENGLQTFLAVTAEPPAAVFPGSDWTAIPTGIGSWTIYRDLGPARG